MNKRVRVIIAIALAVLSSQVWAVDIEAFAGFGGKYKAGTWVPVTVKLKNRGNDTLNGTIATYDSISEQVSQYHTPFSLAGSSEKQYTYYVLQANSANEMPIKLFPSTSVAEADKLKTITKSFTPVFQDNLFLVAAGPANYALNFLEGQSIVLGQASPGGIAPTAALETGLIDLSMLPDRPMGYDCIDLFVLSDLLPSTCDPKQLAALKMWVASGGTIVINGGANYQRLQNEFYADMLPIEVTGAVELSGLTALTTAFGYPLEAGKVTVTSGKLKPGSEVIAHENGVPLVVSRQYGLGKVFFLAFDYAGFPVNGWDGQTKMWKSIILAASDQIPIASVAGYAHLVLRSYGNPQGRTPAANPRFNKIYRTNEMYGYSSNAIESIAGSVPSITMPSMEVIVLFLLGYLVFLVPINYFILSRKNRRELAWITTPIIIIVFTIGAYGISFAMKGSNLLLKTVTVIEGGANSRYATVSTYGGLFSPSRRTYDIELSDPYAVISEPSTDSDYHSDHRRPMLKFLMGETTSIPEMPMDMWSLRTFRVESGCDLGGIIESDLRLEESQGIRRIVGTITNNTDYDIKDCKLISLRRTTEIGDISAKSKVIIGAAIAEKPLTTTPGFSPGPYPASNDTEDHMSLKDQLENELLSRLTNSNKIELLGWMDKGPSEIELKNGRCERQIANCIIFQLPDLTAKGGK